MAERSFRRAVLFGILGALVFLVLGILLCAIFEGLKTFVLFETREVTIDLIVIAVTLRYNAFVIIGFIVGWAYCLFRGTRPRREKEA
jgi:hypothetical protein